MGRKAAIVVGVLIALAPRVLGAQPVPADPPALVEPAEPEVMPSAHLWMRSGSGVLRIDERLFLIPQGSHVFTGAKWDELELEKKRLQEQEIRLTAENKSLSESVDEVPWRIIALGVAVGLVTGAYIGLKF